ncbi:MAG: hypothetical protein KKB13_21980 [Chloroflexi bacterium]|nr:hypothetical protein [Chloroflexota bacterium]
MSKKHLVCLLSPIVMLALTAGLIFAQGSQSLAASSGAEGISPQTAVGSGFTYQGRLTDSGGNPVNDTCDLDFTLWDAESGGALIGHQIVTSIEVNDGYLTVLLNSGGELGARPFEGEARWLKIGVKCSGDPGWDILPGRQLLSATPYALSLRPGALISGTVTGKNALSVVNYGAGGSALGGYSPDGTGVHGQSTNGMGMSGFSFNQVAIYGESTYNTAGFFTSTHGIGVGSNTLSDDPAVAAVEAVNLGAGPGVIAFSNDRPGVYGHSVNGHGVEGVSVNEVGVYGQSDNTAGFFVSVDSVGVHGESINGPAATFTSTNGPGVLVEGAGLEGLRILDTVGGDYIVAGSDADPDFRVTNAGDVFADGGYNCGLGTGAEPGICIIQNSPADLAEMLPARQGLEPGDVLVIGPDGRLARCTRAYQPTVIGAYSTRPGYLGGGEHRGQEGYVPLAVAGIVPVKASAENGPIQPGDLLVASATPGHAMKASPNPPVGTVIGKALAGLDAGSGLILMLAMLQ